MNVTTIIVAAAILLLLVVLIRSRSTSGSIDVDLNRATEADFRALLAAGRKIDAIKVYRHLHRVDLKTAKETVDRIVAEVPPMPQG
jgi:ribosomal protein L7/L12